MKKKMSKRIVTNIAKTTVPKLSAKLNVDDSSPKKTGVKSPKANPSKSPKVVKAVLPKHAGNVTSPHHKKVMPAPQEQKPPTQKPPKPQKQTREQKKWANAAKLQESKMNLMNAVNQEIQKERSNGNTAEVTPQILTLLRTPSFNTKAVEKMQKLFNDRDALREYLYIVDKDGTILSGDKAMSRYEQFVKAGIAKPTAQVDVVLHNFYEHLESMVATPTDYYYGRPDDTAVRALSEFIQRLAVGDTTAPTESQWNRYRPTVNNKDSRDWVMAQNAELVDSISYWFFQWVETIGEDVASTYIEANAADLNESLVKIAIGYYYDANPAYMSLRGVFSSAGASKAMTSGKAMSMELNDMAEQADYFGSEFQDEG